MTTNQRNPIFFSVPASFMLFFPLPLFRSLDPSLSFSSLSSLHFLLPHHPTLFSTKTRTQKLEKKTEKQNMTLYMPLFRSCSTLRSLTQLHAHLVVTGLHSDPLASTKLLESYAQMGSLQSSRLVFETHPSSDSFMFGVLVKCYLWHYLFDQVVLLYHHHSQNGSRLTQNCTFLYPSVLKAVSVVSDLVAGRKLHGRIVRSGLDIDHVIGTSLFEWCSQGV